MNDRIDRQESALADLRVDVGRLEERVEAVLSELQHARRDREEMSRQHFAQAEKMQARHEAQIAALAQQFAPLTENMNRWKGAAAVLAIIAGAIGAAVATGLKKFLGII